jgi:hypothetical protein
MYETNTPAPLPIVPADILDRFHVNEPYDTRHGNVLHIERAAPARYRSDRAPAARLPAISS